MLFWPLHFLSAETRCPLFHMANICVRGCGLSLFLGSPPLRQKTSARQLKPCIALCFCFSSQFFYSFCSQNKQSPFLYLGKSLRDIFISPPFFYHTYLHEYVVKSPGKKIPRPNPPPPKVAHPIFRALDATTSAAFRPTHIPKNRRASGIIWIPQNFLKQNWSIFLQTNILNF